MICTLSRSNQLKQLQVRELEIFSLGTRRCGANGNEEWMGAMLEAWIRSLTDGVAKRDSMEIDVSLFQLIS